MSLMNQPSLPIPEPTAWMTRAKAAETLGCSTRTVVRMVSNGVLREHAPLAAEGEQVSPLYFAYDVRQLAEARALLKPGGAK